MSVLDRVKELSGGSEEGAFQGPSFSGGEQAAEAEQIMQTATVPGQSLTQSPDSKLPYETPAKFSDIQEFIEETFMRFTDPAQIDKLYATLRSPVPVEHIAQQYLQKSFQSGDINGDMLMLAIEPTIYTLISIATFGGITPTLFPEGDDEERAEDEDGDLAAEFRMKSRELFADVEDEDDSGGLTVQDIQAPAVMPKSLLARSQAAFEQTQQAEKGAAPLAPSAPQANEEAI